MAAAREYLKKIGEISDDEPGEAEGGAKETGPETVTAEVNGLEVPPIGRLRQARNFFYGIVRNPLKSPDSKK